MERTKESSMEEKQHGERNWSNWLDAFSELVSHTINCSALVNNHGEYLIRKRALEMENSRLLFFPEMNWNEAF